MFIRHFRTGNFCIVAFVNLRIFILFYWCFLVRFCKIKTIKILNSVTNYVNRKGLPLEGAIGTEVL